MVRGHASSGMTQVAFARLHGIKDKTLSRWRQRLRQELELEQLPSVVEVVVEQEPISSAPLLRASVEVRLGAGCAVVFADGAQPADLADLVLELRRRSLC
jgi:transposase-like protein